MILPGYTHLQHAQPVLFSHHMLAYVWMLTRDYERLAAARRAAGASPLGSAARTPYQDRLLLRGPGYLLKSAIGYLYTRGVRLVGTDRQSVGLPSDERTAHAALLTYGIAVLENLDLSAAPDGQYTLSAAPLKIAGAEGAPCRALLSC